jgi:hypothetical protein
VTSRISTADPVIAPLYSQHPVRCRHVDVGLGGPRVLHDVRERLGHDEMRTRLDSSQEPLGWNVDLNRDIKPSSERPDSCAEATCGQLAGKHAACQLAQLHVGTLNLFARVADERLRPETLHCDDSVNPLVAGSSPQ